MAWHDKVDRHRHLLTPRDSLFILVQTQVICMSGDLCTMHHFSPNEA